MTDFKPKTDEGRRIMTLIVEGDKDADGNLTMNEWQTIRPRVRVRQFHRLDTNADGVLSQADAK